MGFENLNNLIKPETDNTATIEQKADGAENKIENKSAEKIVIERVERELEELNNIKREQGANENFLKTKLNKAIVALSIILASIAPQAAMAGGLSDSEKNSIKSHGDDMFNELTIEVEKMDERESLEKLLQKKQQEKKIQEDEREEREEKTLTPEKQSKVDDLFNEKKITDKKSSATMENFQENIEKQRKNFNKNKENQEAPIRNNPERAKLKWEQMSALQNNLFNDDKNISSMGINIMRANDIVNNIRIKHLSYMDGVLSRENYEQYLNKINQRYNNAFNTEAILNLKNKAE